MKKIALFLALALILAGCAGAPSQSATGSSAAVSAVAPGSSVVAEKVSEPTGIFAKFEDAITTKGYKFEKVLMAAELVGAEEGYKYKLDAGKVEIYIFDTNSEAFKKAAETNKLNLEGFGEFPALIKENFAVITDGVSDDIQGIVDNLK
jgi:hypothetical protein